MCLYISKIIEKEATKNVPHSHTDSQIEEISTTEKKISPSAAEFWFNDNIIKYSLRHCSYLDTFIHETKL